MWRTLNDGEKAKAMNGQEKYKLIFTFDNQNIHLMKKQINLIIAFAILMNISACSNLKVIPIENEYGSTGKKVNESEAGVRFFRPALHVWILRDSPPENIGTIVAEKKSTEKDSSEPKKGEKKDAENSTSIIAKSSILGESFKIQFVYLPDYSKEFIIQWKRGIIGNVNPKFTLADGWNLTGFESEINTGVSATLGITGSAAADASLRGALGHIKEPGLYKLDYSKEKKIFILGEKVISTE